MIKEQLDCRQYNIDEVALQKAKWISHPCARENTLAFEKQFSSEKAVSAQLMVCGLGFFEAYINGKRIDERYFLPAFTDYEKRDVYKNRELLIGRHQRTFAYSYDVTEFLQGNNTLRILVGNGYYHNVDRPEEPYVSYGDKKILFALRLCYEDREELLISDESVSVKYLPEVSGLYEGEYIDFSAAEDPFVFATLASALKGDVQLVDAKAALGDVVGRTLYPISVKPLGKGLLYDFGINHSGGIVCSIKGTRGRKVVIKFAEVLYDNGEPNYETSRWCAYDEKGALTHLIDQIGEYVLSGKEDFIQPRFRWNCYRYAYIEDATDLEIKDMRSYFIHMDVENGSGFTCDNALFNEIYEKTHRTLLCNLHAGVMTDCPHREKRPYTGDGGIIAETALYDFGSIPFLTKWLDDILGSQTEDGFIPYTVPYSSGGGGYAWSNVIASLPTLLYRMTGDVKYIEKSYPILVKWLGYYKAHSVQNIVCSTTGQAWCLGDWLAPEITEFNIPFMHTLCYHQAVSAALFSANVLGNQDVEKWVQLKEDIAQAIHKNFFDEGNYTYCKGIQGENVLPLAYGIVPKKYREKLKEKVRYTYAIENDLHLDTGIIGTPILLEYLTENGMEDIAYAIMTQTSYPSYAYMLEGETTLSEHWSKRWPDYHIGNSDIVVKGGGHLSHCHPMFGSVVAWLYKRVAGLDLSAVYQGSIRFTPRFTRFLKTASATSETPFGKTSISWRNETDFSAELQIPNGLSGVFELQTDKPLYVQTSQGQKQTYKPEGGMVRIVLPAGKIYIATSGVEA